MGVSLTRAPATDTPGHGDAGRSPDWFEAGMLACLFALCAWVMAWAIGRAAAHGWVWTGADGLHVTDQLQYMAWMRLAGEHILIANPYQLAGTAATFLHPGFLVSGILFRLGVPLTVAYLVWKPVAVLALFFAVRAYVRRFLPTRGAQRAALVLALLFVSTAAYVASITGSGAVSRLYLLGFEVELWPGTWLWGYPFTVLAVAAMPVALLAYEHDRSRGRVGAMAPLAALLSSWLQPWQGATLLGILVLSEVGARLGAFGRGATGADTPRTTEQLRLTAPTLAAGAAPLVYYALLSRFDGSWALAGTFNRIPAWPVWALAVTLAPLALPAALAYGQRPQNFGELALRLWPLVGVALYWVIGLAHVGTFALHALQGLTLPLAVLAVQGVRAHVNVQTPAARWAAAGVVALLIVPPLVWKLNDAQRSTRGNAVAFPGAPPNPYYLTHGEDQALSYLDHDPRAGGVLSSALLGEVIPERAGRRTWIGLPSWTPDYVARMDQSERLLSGSMPVAQARQFVRASGAGYVLLDCEHPARAAAALLPLVAERRQFGCATVLRLRLPR